MLEAPAQRRHRRFEGDALAASRRDDPPADLQPEPPRRRPHPDTPEETGAPPAPAAPPAPPPPRPPPRPPPAAPPPRPARGIRRSPRPRRRTSPSRGSPNARPS